MQLELTEEEARFIQIRREMAERIKLKNEVISLLKLWPGISRSIHHNPDIISFDQFIEKLNIYTLRGLVCGIKSRG